MVTASSRRVPENTAPHVNWEIAERTRISIAYYGQHREGIPRRLEQLEREWDIERALATGSSCLSLFGLTLGLRGRRRWLVLPLAVQAFYLQHTLQGWCPPLPILRRLGFRTPEEIEDERSELQLLLMEPDSAGT
jgi:hypothetical protein